MMRVERGAVVDEPETTMPDEHVGVASGTVDIGHVAVKPDNLRREVGTERVDQWVEGDRARQVVECQVETSAIQDQGMNLRVWLRPGEVGVQVGKDDFRHRQAE